MDQDPWAPRKFSGCEEGAYILQNLHGCCHVHMSPQLVPILIQINPLHTLPNSYLRAIFILLSHLHSGLLSVSFLQIFIQDTVCFSVPCSHIPHPSIILNLTTLIIFCVHYSLQSSSKCCFFKSAIVFGLCTICSSLNVRVHISHTYERTES